MKASIRSAAISAHDTQAAGDDHIARLVLDGLDEVAVDDAEVRPGRRAGQGA